MEYVFWIVVYFAFAGAAAMLLGKVMGGLDGGEDYDGEY